MNFGWPMALGLMLPLLGTTLGAGMVFFMKGALREGVRRALLGFAAGVMMASLVFSLTLPSVELAGNSRCAAWFPAALGIPLGALFFWSLDAAILFFRRSKGLPGADMLLIAATLCNIPDGMAMGVVLTGMLMQGSIPASAVVTLAFGIAIQNFPEGAVISMPLPGKGVGRGKAFFFGFLSGAVEPVAAAVTLFLTSLITPVLPYILAFAAGAMLYVVVKELIPEAQSDSGSPVGTLSAVLGFTLMVILNVVFR